MKFFFQRFTEILRSVMPVQILFIFACCLYFMYIDGTAERAAGIIIGGSALFVIFSAAAALGEYHSMKAMRARNHKIIGNCFRGFSKADRLFSAGVAEMDCKLFGEALEDFKDAEELELSEKERAILCFYIGSCYRIMGYPTNAALYYGKSIEYNIDDDFVYVLAARCNVTNGSYSTAMKLYEELLQRNSPFEYIYTDMGMCCLKANDPDKAMEFFNISINKGMNYAFALGGCSLSCLMKKDVENSKKYFAKAIVNNLGDISNFRRYYCSVAEAAGCLDLIDDFMKNDTSENPNSKNRDPEEF